jgi:cell division ATPase FtsA
MLPGGIVFTGGGSGLFNLEEAAKKCLRLPARLGTFSLCKDYAAKNTVSLPANFKEQILNDPRWSTALGLCLMGANEISDDFTTVKNHRGNIFRTVKKLLSQLIP